MRLFLCLHHQPPPLRLLVLLGGRCGGVGGVVHGGERGFAAGGSGGFADFEREGGGLLGPGDEGCGSVGSGGEVVHGVLVRRVGLQLLLHPHLREPPRPEGRLHRIGAGGRVDIVDCRRRDGGRLWAEGFKESVSKV